MFALRNGRANWIDDEQNGYRVIKDGSGTLVLGVNGWKFGGVVLNEGRMKIVRDDAFGSGEYGHGTFTMTGGWLSASGSSNRSFPNDFFLGGSLILGDQTDDGFMTFQAAYAGTLTDDTILDVRSGVALNGDIGDEGNGFSLTKIGDGALALGGENTFSGGVSVQEGRLRIGDNGALGEGNLTMTGGALSSNSHASRNLANDYSLSGSITMGHPANNGAMTLSGIGTLTGHTVIDTVVNTTLSAAIGQEGGDWSLTKTGEGILSLTLTETNTFAGGLIVQEGTLSVNNHHHRLGAGTVTLDGGTLRYTGKSANATIHRDMTVGQSHGTILLNTGDRYIDWAGTVSGGGTLTKDGVGLLKLSGNNDHTGDIDVTVGTLQINGTHTGGGLITVRSGATLGGTGTAGDARIESGGILSPGESIGQLTLGGLTLDGGSIFDYQMDRAAGPDAAGDLLAVSDLNLSVDQSDRAILTLTDLATTGSWEIGDKLTLIRYSGDWNDGLFDYDGMLENNSTFTFSGIDWLFRYNDAAPGTNFVGEFPAGSSFVTMTAVPEPGTLAMLAVFGLCLLARRRRMRR